MKKISTLLLTMMLAGFSGKAQTITFPDLPVVGEAWAEFIDTTGGSVSVSAPGSGQTWNFATSFTVNDTSGFQFLPAGQLYGAPFFSNTTMGVNDINDDGDTTSLHFITAPSGLYLDGFYTNNGDSLFGNQMNVIDLDPDQLYFPTPFSYTSQRIHLSKFTIEFVDTVNFPAPTPIRFIIGFTQDFEADADGSLTTPLGTFNNVLRVRHTTIQSDTIYYFDGFNGWTYLTDDVTDTTIQYLYAQNGPHMMLMTTDIDPVTTDVIRASYYDPVVLVGNRKVSASTFGLYPNPCNGEEVTLITGNDLATQVLVYNASGALVSNLNVQNEAVVKFSTAGWDNGLYLVQVTDRAGHILQHTKLTVSK